MLEAPLSDGQGVLIMTTFIRDKAVVVVGDDYSENSRDALKAACTSTETLTEGAIHIVHVIKSRTSLVAGDGVGPYDLDADRAALEAVTLSAATEAAANPAREIVQLASDLSADLIVVGTHGRTGTTKRLLGSVAQSVLTRASCPVLVVRTKDLPSWPEIVLPCADCATVRQSSLGQPVWCERHSHHHASAHTYYVRTESFGLGGQTFRGLS
jgi:nucleotide-binding universal stress UspA family protein